MPRTVMKALVATVALISLWGCADSRETAEEKELRSHLQALRKKCGLEKHVAFRVEGKSLLVLGVDPRKRSTYGACFLEGFEGFEGFDDVFYGFVYPQEHRFMGPPEARPPKKMLDEIERRLSRDDCVGKIKHWWREYGFTWNGDRLDPRTLHFVLHSSWPGIRNPGRTVYDSDMAFILDDGSREIRWGSYDVATAQLWLENCEPSRDPRRTSKRLVP